MTPTAENPARILIVDDHAIVRYGMGVMLAGADDLTLCGEAETIDQALSAICELKPDAVVVDLVLKNENGLDLIRAIRRQESEIRGQGSGARGQGSAVRGQGSEDGLSAVALAEDAEEIPHPASRISHPAPQTPALPPSRPLPILVMSMHNESTHAEKALRAGAQGYIMKENADEVLVDALRTVLSGELHVSGRIREKMLRTYIDGDDDAPQTGIDSLTAREKQVFEGVGRGLTSKEIAEQFSLSPRTVEVHRANIKKKLECDTAARLLRVAVQWVESR